MLQAGASPSYNLYREVGSIVSGYEFTHPLLHQAIKTTNIVALELLHDGAEIDQDSDASGFSGWTALTFAVCKDESLA